MRKDGLHLKFKRSWKQWLTIMLSCMMLAGMVPADVFASDTEVVEDEDSTGFETDTADSAFSEDAVNTDGESLLLSGEDGDIHSSDATEEDFSDGLADNAPESSVSEDNPSVTEDEGYNENDTPQSVEPGIAYDKIDENIEDYDSESANNTDLDPSVPETPEDEFEEEVTDGSSEEYADDDATDITDSEDEADHSGQDDSNHQDEYSISEDEKEADQYGNEKNNQTDNEFSEEGGVPSVVSEDFITETVSEEPVLSESVSEEPCLGGENDAALSLNGSCGENLIWALEDDGTLTISGAGDMYDYDQAENPWMEKGINEQVTRVVLEDGISSIGNNALSQLYNAESVSIPTSITAIGISAFNEWTALVDVFYEGSREDWEKIVVSEGGNEDLLNANIYFSKVEESDVIEIIPTIILSETTFIYNGETQKPTVTVKEGDSVIPEDSYTVEYEGDLTNVGTYNVKVVMQGNYSGSGTTSYKIAAKEITPTVALSKSSFTYNGKVQKPGVTVKDGASELSTSDYTVSYDSGLRNVGSYKITVKLKGNYSGTRAVTYKITAKAITPTVTLSKTSFTYNGKTQKPGVTVKDGTTELSTSNYTVSYDSGLKNVGSYKVTVKLKGNYSGTKAVTYKITAKAITPSVSLSKTSFTYNEKVQKPSVTVKDGATKLATSNYTVSFASGLKNVGTYKVTIKLRGNYSGSKVVSYKITAKKITPAVTLSKTAYVYNGKAQKPGVTVKTGDKKLSSSNYSVTYASGRKNAGTYKVTIKMKGNYSGTKTVSFKINPKKITPSVTLSKTVFTYNGKSQKPSVKVKNGSNKLPSASYTVTYGPGLANVGTHKITVKLKGNYSGSKTVSYKINPKGTSITSAVGEGNKIKVGWAKQVAQITGYQIQYSTSNTFASGNQTITVSKADVTSTAYSRPNAWKNYYIRIRTYKKIGSEKYFSAWSKGAYTAVKQVIRTQNKTTLKSPYSYYETEPNEVNITFTTTNRMMFTVPVKISTSGYITKGGVRIILKNSSGMELQNDLVNLKGYSVGDTYEDWFYDDAFFVSPGTYTYTIKNVSDDTINITYSIYSYLKKSTSASINKNVSVKSGNWVKIGKVGEGCPLTQVTYPSNKVITGWDSDIDGTLWVYADKKGTSTVTVQLSTGNKYTCTVNVTAGEPDFYAELTGYYTRDNYFEVKVKNLRESDLTIIRKGARVEDVDYKEYDRNIKKADNVIIKHGETKYIRFYVDGSYTWTDYKDFTLCAKMSFEGITYDWHTWWNDSVYKKNGKWWSTYWDEEGYSYWY